jgi:hypothetical protein
MCIYLCRVFAALDLVNARYELVHHLDDLRIIICLTHKTVEQHRGEEGASCKKRRAFVVELVDIALPHFVLGVSHRQIGDVCVIHDLAHDLHARIVAPHTLVGKNSLAIYKCLCALLPRKTLWHAAIANDHHFLRAEYACSTQLLLLE